jgi:ferredoxin-thioredoxin reductase catalytic chain
MYENVKKRYWRCHICGDIHFGERPPEICPTCGFKNSFAPSDSPEVTDITRDVKYVLDTPEKLIESWQDFTAKADFKLWEDEQSVKDLATGELENMRNKGLRYCPCRITTGERQKDIDLVCPCNFKIQRTWKEHGECWCGLFVKR